MRKLIGIGTGPGAEDLITLRALNALKEADHIFVPKNKNKTRAYDIVAPYIDEEKVVFLPFNMTNIEKDAYKKAYEQIDDMTKEGETSVLLTLGDGTIYATLMEVFRYAETKDFSLELVPGIPAFLAGMNGLIEPLVKKGESFMLIDGLETDVELHGDMLAILKTIRAENIWQRLQEKAYHPLYLENIETDRWLVSCDIAQVKDRRAYMSLILARRKPWNMAEISKRIGERIEVL